MSFDGKLNLLDGRADSEWSLEENLLLIFGERPLEFKMPPYLEKLGKYLCGFPRNLDLKVSSPKICKSDKVMENTLQSQILIKRILGAVLFAINAQSKQVVGANLTVQSIPELLKLSPEDPARAYVALSYAAALCVDTISKLELKKCEAQATSLTGQRPHLDQDPSSKKRTRDIFDPNTVASDFHREQKFRASLARAKRASSNPSPNNVTVTFQNDRFRGRDNFRPSRDRFRPNSTTPPAHRDQGHATQPRGPPFQRGRGRGGSRF